MAVNSLFGNGSGGSQSDIKTVFELWGKSSGRTLESSLTSGEGVLLSESDLFKKGFVGSGSN